MYLSGRTQGMRNKEQERNVINRMFKIRWQKKISSNIIVKINADRLNLSVQRQKCSNEL